MSLRWLPNINWVRAVLCPAVVFIATSMDRGYQTDFWHHIASGREIARTGHVLDADPFTFTVGGQAVRDANWLTQLAYFRLYELGGLPLVQTANSLVLATAAAVLVWICRRRGGSTVVAAGVSVFAFAGIWQTLLIRPQSVSLLLFVVLYAILLEAEQRRWLLLLPPPLMALWANVHGGFPIGLFLIGAFIAATLAERWSAPLRRRLFPKETQDSEDVLAATWAPAPVIDFHRAFGFRGCGLANKALSIRRGNGLGRLIACFVASGFATLINPYGISIYKYVVTLSATAAGRQVEEWMPPSMGLWVGRAWVASIAGLIVLLAFVKRRPRSRDLFFALCFLPLACSSVRMVPWWLLAVAPVLAATLGRTLAMAAGAAGAKYSFQPRPSFAAAAMLVLIGFAVAVCTPGMDRYNPVLGTLRPASRPESNIQAMVDRIGPGKSARVFSRLEWGEYLDWSAHSAASVFMDGRIEIYPNDVWQQYHAITSARADWQTLLDARGVNYLLLDSAFHGELMPRVDASPRWQRVDAAGPAVLYVRREPTDIAAADVQETP